MRKTNFAFGGIRTHDFLHSRQASYRCASVLLDLYSEALVVLR